MFAWSTDASSGARAAETAAPPRTAPRTALPDPAQLVWMEELREFLREPTMRLDNAAAVQALYIDYCSRWHGTPESDRWNPNTSINAIGVVIGAHVVVCPSGAPRVGRLPLRCSWWRRKPATPSAKPGSKITSRPWRSSLASASSNVRS